MQSLGVKGEDAAVRLNNLCGQKVLLENRIQKAGSDEEKQKLNQELARLATQIARLTESLRELVE